MNMPAYFTPSANAAAPAAATAAAAAHMDFIFTIPHIVPYLPPLVLHPQLINRVQNKKRIPNQGSSKQAIRMNDRVKAMLGLRAYLAPSGLTREPVM